MEGSNDGQAVNGAPLPITPRGLSRSLAALYVGIPVDRFDSLVQSGQMPAPKTVAGMVLWDRLEIDAAFTAVGSQIALGDQPVAIGAKEPISSKPTSVPNAYTPKSLAQRWLCSERTIRNMLERGDLPFFRLGGTLLRIKREDVETYEATAGLEPVVDFPAVEALQPSPKKERLKRLDLNQLRPLRGPRRKPSGA